MLTNRFISVVGAGFVSFATCAALPTALLAQQPDARQPDNRTAQTIDATAAAERVERALGNDPVLATFNLNASDQGIVIGRCIMRI